jgi:arylsulfatase
MSLLKTRSKRKIDRSPLFSLFILVGILSLHHAAYPQKNDLPNIIIIFTDDLGYGDLGCYGAEGYATPNLDRLAESGMKFTGFYASEAVCSASRASLLTGCYSERVGIQGALSPNSKVGLNPEEVTIAEMLKKKKYKTAVFGKWHLGHDKKFLPLQHGFDEYFGLPYSNDMWPVGYDGKPSRNFKLNYPTLMLYEGNKPVHPVMNLQDQALLTTMYTERAVQFIEKNRKKHFFLYLAHSMPHVPLGVSEKYRGKTENGIFGDVISEIDWSVGQILTTLDKYGLIDKTLIIFTSDNGPWLNMGNHAGKAGPLREGKGTAFEGGVRVPCVISWQGVVPAGITCNELVTTMDVLPTIAAITGAPLPDTKIDGMNVLPLLTNEKALGPRKEFWYYYSGELRAIRKDNWKLIFPHYTISYNGVEPGQDGYPGKYAYFTTGLELYNLEDDIGESQDVSESFPDIVESLKMSANQAREELGDMLTGVVGTELRQPGRLFASKVTAVSHSAIDKKLVLNYIPNPRYAGEGPKTLVNGLRGSLDFHDGQWLGFRGKDIEIVIDMGKPVKKKKMICAFLENQASWIFLPSQVMFYASDDGEHYHRLNTFHDTLDQRPKSSVKEYETLIKGGMYRYFKVEAANAGVCPEWHPGNGQDSWIFIDEVIIK